MVAPAAFAVSLLVPASGFSDAVSISNPSFEEPALQGGNITSIGSPTKWDPGQSAAAPGWGGVLGFSQTGSATAVAGIRPSTNAASGQQVLYLEQSVSSGFGLECVVFQDAGEVKPATIYTLRVAVGVSESGVADGASGSIALVSGSNGPDGILLGSADFSPTGVLPAMQELVATAITSPYATGHLSVVLGMFAVWTGYSIPHQISFDNVRLEAAPDTNQPPRLQLGIMGREVVLSWPSWASNYVAQATGTLEGGGNWVGLAGTPAVLSDKTVLTNTVSEDAAFYRLIRP